MTNVSNKFSKYIVSSNSTIKNALEIIDNNKMRFALVVEKDVVKGVISDGDIRRLIISGAEAKSPIIYNTDFHYVDFLDDFEKVCEKFRNNSIDFLPILKFNKLFQILTKDQFHVFLLEGISYSSELNFSQFDTLSIEHEVYNRPWGFYKSVFLSSHAQAKIITLFPDSEFSLQKHFYREEHWVVIKGIGEVTCGVKNYKISPGDYIHIPKETLHQVKNTSLENNLLLSEVQLGDYFGEDDIIRIKDKYGRD